MGNCIVCGKRAAPWEKNKDGTYLHTVCAMPSGFWPEKKKEKSSE